jgi:glutamate formiminotransferase/formiminotetrahydrofolate cyclodeaminase
MAGATQVPVQTAEACVVVMRAAVEAAQNGNANALSDARTGGAMAWAGLLGAAENVRINASANDSTAAGLVAKTEAAVRDGRELAAALGLTV